MNRSSNDRRALGLGYFRQTHDNTTNAVNLDVIPIDFNQLCEPYPTTREIVIDRANGVVNCEACVNWAIGLLLNGEDQECISHLAGECGPFDAPTIAMLRDQVLNSIGKNQLSDDEIVCHLLAYRLSDAGTDISLIRAILRDARDEYVVREIDGLYQLYLLYHAWEELDEFGQQWYVDKMDDQNSLKLTIRFVDRFVATHKNWG